MLSSVVVALLLIVSRASVKGCNRCLAIPSATNSVFLAHHGSLAWRRPTAGSSHHSQPEFSGWVSIACGSAVVDTLGMKS